MKVAPKHSKPPVTENITLLPPGTLVTPNEEAMERGFHPKYNRELTRDHGWLYTIEGKARALPDQRHNNMLIYDCKSLATGHSVSWVHWELEVADD